MKVKSFYSQSQLIRMLTIAIFDLTQIIRGKMPSEYQQGALNSAFAWNTTAHKYLDFKSDQRVNQMFDTRPLVEPIVSKFLSENCE